MALIQTCPGAFFHFLPKLWCSYFLLSHHCCALWHDRVHDGQRWDVHTSEDSFLTAQSFGVNLKFMCAYVATLLTFLYLTYSWALLKLKTKSGSSKTGTFKSIQTLIGGVKLARLDVHNWNLPIIRVPDFLIKVFFSSDGRGKKTQNQTAKQSTQPQLDLISGWVRRAYVHQSICALSRAELFALHWSGQMQFWSGKQY